MTGHVRFHNGSWKVVLFQGRRMNSKGKLADRYRWIGGFATEREAQEELTRQLAAKQEGSYVEPHKMTVGQYLEHWLSVRKTSLSPTTHQRYEGICRDNIIPALGAFLLVKLSAIDVEQFYTDMLTKGCKPKSKKQQKQKIASGLSSTTVLQF